LEILTYPHPTLRHKSKPLRKVDAELKQMVGEMFELMYANKGIGLAANQVDLPLRFFILNVAGKKGEGEEMVFLNPVISFPKGIDPSDHPYYKRVYLRVMPIDGGTPKVIAYVYGGQGTINVPSWSPDGRMIAFVSNSGE